jgi:4-hydroxy-2-oxoglutarate aldolase
VSPSAPEPASEASSGIALEGIIPALATPFTADGDLDLAALRRNLQGLGGADLAGYLVLGSTGEFPHLSAEEAERLIAAVVEEAAGRPVIAQTGAQSTRAAVAMTRRAAELGARAVLVVPPYYYRGSMGERELETYYEAVAEASPVPVVLYHIPQTTGVAMPVALVARLAEHPNVAGIKDSSGDLGRLGEILASVPPGWSVLTGSDAILLGALAHGAQGAILAAANVLPYELCDLYRRARGRDWSGAADIQRRLTLPLRVAGRHGIPGYKAAMDLMGFKGGFPREPLLPLEEEAHHELLNALRAAALVRL